LPRATLVFCHALGALLSANCLISAAVRSRISAGSRYHRKHHLFSPIACFVFNVSGYDGTITRFGQKAQNKSLLIFAGAAYNVEQGVTNEAFPNERDDTAGCRFNAVPEDATNLVNPNISGFAPSDLRTYVNFAAFVRLSAGPTPAPTTNTTVQGANQFVNVGCADCAAAGDNDLVDLPHRLGTKHKVDGVRPARRMNGAFGRTSDCLSLAHVACSSPRRRSANHAGFDIHKRGTKNPNAGGGARRATGAIGLPHESPERCPPPSGRRSRDVAMRRVDPDSASGR
jgi:hypothetical protein